MIYTLFIEKKKRGYSHTESIGKQYTSLSKAIKAVRKYASKYFGDDFFFIQKDIKEMCEDEIVTIAVSIDDCEISSINITAECE